jgi:hypothetical protein
VRMKVKWMYISRFLDLDTIVFIINIVLFYYILTVFRINYRSVNLHDILFKFNLI